jgi:hypothetical protein
MTSEEELIQGYFDAFNVKGVNKHDADAKWQGRTQDRGCGVCA